jgi:hypothetical protein
MSDVCCLFPPSPTKLILNTRDENVSIDGSMDMLRRLCKDGMEAPDLMDQAVQREPCLNHAVDNVQGMEPAPTGTSEQAAISRLRKDRPDRPEKVKQGEITITGDPRPSGFDRA